MAHRVRMPWKTHSASQHCFNSTQSARTPAQLLHHSTCGIKGSVHVARLSVSNTPVASIKGGWTTKSGGIIALLGATVWLTGDLPRRILWLRRSMGERRRSEPSLKREMGQCRGAYHPPQRGGPGAYVQQGCAAEEARVLHSIGYGVLRSRRLGHPASMTEGRPAKYDSSVHVARVCEVRASRRSRYRVTAWRVRAK